MATERTLVIPESLMATRPSEDGWRVDWRLEADFDDVDDTVTLVERTTHHRNGKEYHHNQTAFVSLTKAEARRLAEWCLAVTGDDPE